MRALRWWDLPVVLDIEQRSFVDETPWSAESWWAELALVPVARTYVVAVQGERVVGYAGCRWADDTGDIMTVAVDAPVRRTGAGGALVAALLDEATRRRARVLTLEVRASNEPAQALYRAHGFTPLTRRRGYYGPGVDGVVMRTPVPATPGHQVGRSDD